LEQRLDIFGRINTLPDYCQGAWPFLWYLFASEPVLWRALAPLKQELMHRAAGPLQSLARSIPSTVVSLVDEPAMKRINSRIQASERMARRSALFVESIRSEHRPRMVI